MRCSTHPRYQNKRKPRVVCETCWTMWVMSKFIPLLGKRDG